MSVYAVMMAGGEGTRLHPITLNMPKPLIPLAGAPVMSYALRLLKRHGVIRAGITLRYLSHQICRAFGSGEREGVQLDYYLENKPLGTAGSVLLARERLTEPTIILSGDGLTDCDLTDALRAHAESGALATLVLARSDHAQDYGVVDIADDGRVRSFIEKPKGYAASSAWVNTGTYILSPRALADVPPDMPFDFGRQLFPLLISRGQAVYGYPMRGYWCDVGNPRDYLCAQRALLEGRVALPVSGTPVCAGVYVDAEAHVHESAVLQDCVIGAGARIGPNARVVGSSVGAEAFVGENAIVEHSVLMRNACVEKDARVHSGVLCQWARMSEGAWTGEASVLGEHMVLGAGSRLDAGARVWASPDAREAERMFIGVRASEILGKMLWTVNPAVLAGKGGMPHVDA